MAQLDPGLDTATIAQIHCAIRAGSISAQDLVQMSMAQIDAHDQSGAGLNAVVTVNRHAPAEARMLDEHLAASGELVGSLHGVPVVIKDCLETVEMPTSFGSEIFADYMASEDATVVAKLKGAGAIIVAKTTLPDWATSWFAYSSRSGQTRNPYVLDRDPGGSSSGTGAAVAAAYAPIGLGTDCGGSVRLPASFCNLVGVRSTPGIISRKGCNPLVGMQDTIGPMARNVADAVRLFSVIAGYDASDPLTCAHSVARAPASYLPSLVQDALAGTRIGVVRNAFGTDSLPAAAAVNHVMRGALAELRAGGAELVDIEIPNLAQWLVETSLYLLKSKYDINAFLAERPHAPAKSVQEIVASGRYHEKLDLLEGIAAGPDAPFENLDYYRAYAAREDFMRLVVNIMARGGLSTLVYPTAQVPPPRRSETDSGEWTTLTFPTNTLIGSQTWMPAMTVPAGFTDDGLPVGMEILARPYDESTMFRIAYGFEQVRGHRRHPEPVPMVGA
ncbi:MAG: amidase [Gammaproteobacteria bacterium]